MTILSMPLQSPEEERLYEALLKSLDTKDAKGLAKYLESAEFTALPTVLRKLTNEQRVATWALLTKVSPHLSANLLDHFSNNELVTLMSQLPVDVTEELFPYLQSTDRRMLVSRLPSELQAQLKRSLPFAWETEERAALHYAKDTAGGVSNSEILKLSSNATVTDLEELLRTDEGNADRLEWRYVYLQDECGNYLGALKTKDVLLLPAGAALKAHTDDSIPVILPSADLTELKSTLDTTLHPLVPVVDERGFQIGVVGFKHLNEALYERSKKQLLEQSGVLGGDEFRSMSTIMRNIRRLAFLLPSVVLSYAAVSIIAAYEPIIEQIAVLAAILPLVANLSGAAGNQAVAVSIRELSMGHITARNVLYVVVKEIPIGIINGVLIGGVLAALTLLTDGGEHLGLPILIGAAYAFSSTVAVMIGGALPLFLKRFKLDPAMLSSPMLTTMTDAVSFFTVLYLAQMFLL